MILPSRKLLAFIVGVAAILIAEIPSGGQPSHSAAREGAASEPVSASGATSLNAYNLQDMIPARPLPDLAAAETSIRKAIQTSFAALKSNDAGGYVADLAPDYRQVDLEQHAQGKAEALRSMQESLKTYGYTETSFGIVELRLVTPSEAAVTLVQRVVFATKNTPPSYIKASNGRTIVQNNTIITRQITLLRQTWNRRGDRWVLLRAQVLDRTGVAVL